MLGKISKWVEDDFENVLMKSKVLRLIIYILGGSTVFVAGMIIWNAWEMDLCKPIFSPTCLGNFTDNMQLPIKLLTATIALSGFWALIFRSHQTTEQIKTSQEQADTTNRQLQFNNYIAHKKAFMESMDTFEERANCKVINRDYLYKKVFPQNSFTNWSPDADIGYIESLVKYHERLQNAVTTSTPTTNRNNNYQMAIINTKKIDSSDRRLAFLLGNINGFMEVQDDFRRCAHGACVDFPFKYKLRDNNIYDKEILQMNVGKMQGWASLLSIGVCNFAGIDDYPKKKPCNNLAFHQLVHDSGILYRHLRPFIIGENIESFK